MEKSFKISILLPTFNCEATVRTTLKSIQWADEIIIVDSFSDDGTLDIAKEFGSKIVQHEYINSAKQKNWALQFCSHSWIFQIDSDECLEMDSEEKIKNAIQNCTKDINCFKMPRKNYVLGKWVKYGGLYPDWQFRLFKKDSGQWLDREVHSRMSVTGDIGILDTYIIHRGMPNISKQLSNLNRYTKYEAEELKKRNKRFSITRWIISPPLIFLKKYFIQQGFRDGFRGLLLAVYISFYVFLSHAKLREIEMMELQERKTSN